MMSRPDIEDDWYDSSRFWTHSRHDWDPTWYQKLGWPHFGGDEWGRRVVTVGFAWVGYLSWAYRTCWRQCCHVARQQTYDMEAGRWEELQEKIAVGQCVCHNRTISRHYFWYDGEYGPDGIEPPKTVARTLDLAQRCECGHVYAAHDRDGFCGHVARRSPGTPTIP
jgi:hypothetical protein